MYLVVLYFSIIIMLFVLIYFNKIETFFASPLSAAQTTGYLESQVSTSSNINITTRSIEDMDIIDFSLLDRLEKTKRDEKSEQYEDCLAEYTSNKYSTFRDINEIMFSNNPNKEENDSTIFDKTSFTPDRKYYQQIGFW